MTRILRPVCTGVFCLFCLITSFGQFAYTYEGPDTLYVDENCAAILDWGHPGTPQVFPTMPGQVIISWMIFSISGGYAIGDPVPAGVTVTVFYQARDNMGHIALYGFNIVVADVTPPVFDPLTLPSDTTVMCTGGLPIGMPAYSDNCDDANTIELNFMESGNAGACNGGTVTRTWTITDASGNSASYAQHIMVMADTTAPVITGIPVDGSAPCGDIMDAYTTWIAAQRAVFAADDAGCGMAILSDNAPPVESLLGFCGELEVSFFAADSCDNTSSVIASFIVSNTTAPDITVPASNMTASCESGDPQSALNTWINNHGGADAVDDCSIVTWTTDPADPVLSLICDGPLIVTFVANDGCGNTATTSAEFVVQDNTPPTIVSQAQNRVINCSTADFAAELASWLSSRGNASATDVCTDDDSLHVSFEIDGVSLDSAGVILAFQDSIMNGTCTDGIIIDGFVFDNVLALINLDFVFTDDCGNSASTGAIFAIRDILGPTWTVAPQDSILGCFGGDVVGLFTQWYESAGFAEGSDDCQTIYYTGVPSYEDAVAALNAGLDTACASGLMIEVAFQLHDFCGNTNASTESAVFGIAVNSGPELTEVATDLEFPCSGDVESALHAWLDTLGGAEVQAACGSVTWTFGWSDGGMSMTGAPGAGPYPDISLAGCNSSLQITFSASDLCENVATSVAAFSFVDTIAPSISVDAEVTIPCDSIEFIVVNASDDCDANPTISFVDVNMNGDTSTCLNGTLMRTWTVIDACGNTATALQVIHTSDEEAPEFIAPADTIVFCSGEGALNTGMPTAVQDNCDPAPVITFLDEVTGSDCDQMIIRKWIVRDACMNVRTAIQEITLIDTLPPVLEVPPVDLVLECSANGDLQSQFQAWLTNAGYAQIADNCSTPRYFIAEQGSYMLDDTTTWPGIAPTLPVLGCGNDTLASLQLTLVYADACGNAAEVPLSVTITDMTGPVLEACMEDTLIVLAMGECSTEVTFTPPRAFDLCGASIDSIELNATKDLSSPVPGDTMTLVDSIDFQFVVSGPPAFVFDPVDVEIILAGADADGSGEYFVIKGEGGVVLGNTNPAPAECDTSVTVLSIPATLFNSWAVDGLIDLRCVPNDAPGGADGINDICPGATAGVTLRFVQGIQDSLHYAYQVDTLPEVILDAPGDVSVTLSAGMHDFAWHISDCAGNVSECVTHITLLDSDVPQIECPDDITVLLEDDDETCTVSVTLVKPIVSDLCGIDDASLQYQIIGDSIVSSDGFGDLDSITIDISGGSYSIQYQVSDLSGNTATCAFQLIVNDPVAPNAQCKPGTAYVSVSGVEPVVVDPAIIDAGSTDNCRIDTMLVMPAIFPCDSANTTQLVELIVIDASGNADTCIAELVIEVEDVVPTFFIGICANDSLHLFANAPPAQGVNYTFSWSGPNGFSSNEENPVIPGANMNAAGLYTVTVTGAGGCTTSGTVEVTIGEMIPPLTVEALTVCEGEPVVLYSSSYNQPVTYRWYRGMAPGGILLGTTVDTTFSDVPPLTGQYSYYVIVEAQSCETVPSAGITIEVVEKPVATVQTPFIEVCAGGTLTLGTEVMGDDITYQWTGPSGFMSDAQFPVINNVAPEQAGTYSLVVAVGSCLSLPATTDVVISPRPEAPVISGDSIYCTGGSLVLVAGNAPDADQYIWQSPTMNPISTMSDTLILNNINESMSGGWTVVAMLGDCPSDTGEVFTISIESTLPVEATNDGPVCDGSGDSVTLIVPIIPGVSYIWEGPGGFTSMDPNPVVIGIEGTYTVTATSSTGCMAVSSTVVMAGDPPSITGLSNTAGICADSTQSLTFAVTLFPADSGAYTYHWTGPNGFQSDEMIPVIPGLTSALNGTYSLVVSLGSCMSDPVSTEVNVLNAPAKPVVSGITNYCSGETIVLDVTGYPFDSVTYIWSTPVGNFERFNDSTLTLDNITINNTGSYTVMVVINGCTSLASDSVHINVAQVVNQPVIQAPASLCAGDSLRLSAQTIPNATYHWTGPNGFMSDVQNPVIFPVTAAASGAYQVIVQVGECVSDPSVPFTVTVMPLPQVPMPEVFEGSVCLGDPLPATLCVGTASATNGAQYVWSFMGSPLNTPTDMRCITITDFSVFSAGLNSITVEASLNGCLSQSAGSIDIQMYDIPAMQADAGPDATFCADDEVELNATQPSTGTGVWTSVDPDVDIENSIDPFSGISNLAEGDNALIWTLSFESCANYSSDTVIISIEDTPVAFNDSVIVQFGMTTDINVVLNDLIQGEYTLTILPGGPLKGNALYRGQGIITYDPNIGYVGPDRISYEICSVVCPEQCTVADLIIQVGNETDCFIPSLFTPNRDGINDRLIIPCLETERFPGNRIAIFNEWGDAVYEASPYLNDWEGTHEGKDLPVATYFYIIDFGDGRPIQNGFLILER